MILADYINLLGLSIDILGALLMFLFTPKVESRVFVGGIESENKLIKKDIRHNRLIRFGMILLVGGFGLQALSTFL